MKRFYSIFLLFLGFCQPSFGMFRLLRKPVAEQVKSVALVTTTTTNDLKPSFLAKYRYHFKATKWLLGLGSIIGLTGYSYLKGYDNGIDRTRGILEDCGISVKTGKFTDPRKGLVAEISAKEQLLEDARKEIQYKEIQRVEQVNQLLESSSLHEMDSMVVNFLVRGCNREQAFKIFHKLAEIGDSAGLYRIMEAFQAYGAPDYFNWYAEFVLENYPATFASYIKNHENSTIRKLVSTGQELQRGQRAGWTLPKVIPTLPWSASALDARFLRLMQDYLAKPGNLYKLIATSEGLMALTTMIDAGQQAKNCMLDRVVAGWFAVDERVNAIPVCAEGIQLVNQLLLITNDKRLLAQIKTWVESNLAAIIALGPSHGVVGHGNKKIDFEYDQSFALLYNLLAQGMFDADEASSLRARVKELSPKGWFSQAQYKRFEYLQNNS